MNKIKYLNKNLKNQLNVHLSNITKKKFKNLSFSKIPILMGVLNLTPDSFSDGGKYLKTNKALRHFKELIKSGCDIIDIEVSQLDRSKEIKSELNGAELRMF